MDLKKQILLILMLSCVIFSSSNSDFPYQLSLKKDIPLSLGGISLFVFSKYLKSQIVMPERESILSLDRMDINSLDRSATYHYNKNYKKTGGVFLRVLTPMPILLCAPELFNKKFKNVLTLSVMGIETFFCINGLVGCTKGLTKRKRPYLYNRSISDEEVFEEAYDDKDGLRSFPSADVAMAFGTATFLSTIFSELHSDSYWKYVIWGTSHTTACFIGYCRYRSGKHFPTDIITGAIVGSMIGFLVPRIHLKNNSSLRLSVNENEIGIVLNKLF